MAGANNAAFRSMPLAPKHGIVTVDALISKGTRFTIYSNDVWTRVITVPVMPDVWSSYQFTVPPVLTSFRMDFSELPDAIVTVRKIRIQLPGDTPRSLNLEDLTKWVQYNCKVTYNPADRMAIVRASGDGMYMMAAIAVGAMRVD
jgi:hypothetical protein